MEQKNRRKTKRVLFKSNVILRSGKREIKGTIENLSIKGAGVQLKQKIDLPVGTCVSYDIVLSGENAQWSISGKAQSGLH